MSWCAGFGSAFYDAYFKVINSRISESFLLVVFCMHISGFSFYVRLRSNCNNITDRLVTSGWVSIHFSAKI